MNAGQDGFRVRLHQLGEPPIPGGTGSSNPSPSSGESVANSVFAKAGPRASFRGRHSRLAASNCATKSSIQGLGAGLRSAANGDTKVQVALAMIRAIQDHALGCARRAIRRWPRIQTRYAATRTTMFQIAAAGYRARSIVSLASLRARPYGPGIRGPLLSARVVDEAKRAVAPAGLFDLSARALGGVDDSVDRRGQHHVGLGLSASR